MFIERGKEAKAKLWEVQGDLEFIRDAMDIFINCFCETMPKSDDEEALTRWKDGMYFIIRSAYEHLETVILATQHLDNK